MDNSKKQGQMFQKHEHDIMNDTAKAEILYKKRSPVRIKNGPAV